MEGILTVINKKDLLPKKKDNLNVVMLYSFLLFTLLTGSVLAQNRLNAFIALAHTTSPEAETLKLTKIKNQYQNSLQQVILRPKLELTANVPGYQRSINNITQPDGSQKFQTQSQAYSSFRLNASKSIRQTGGKLSINSGLNRIDLFDPNASTSWSSNIFVINYQQPLFQFNELKYFNQNQLMTASVQNAQVHQLTQQFNHKIASLILNYLHVSEQEAILHLEIKQMAKDIERTKISVTLGKIIQEDLDFLVLDLQRKEMSYKKLLASKGQLLQKLYFHFGDKFDQRSVLTMNINTWHMKTINKDSLLDVSRSDLRNLANEQYISNAKQNIERLSKNSGFSANLDISIGLNNSNEQIDQLFINPQDRQLGSVSLSVPIFNGNKNKLGILQAKNELAQINLDKKLMTQTTLERINQLLLQFEQYKSQINLAQRSLILSEKRMHRYFRLFQNGKITVDQYVQIQQTVLNLKLDVLTTRINYWKLWYSYWF